jgi:hypothetical protein
LLHTQSILSVIYRRKVRITSSRHDPYGLGLQQAMRYLKH